MECRSCNWYLCQDCNSQGKEPRSWFWSSVAALADKASLEFQDLQEVAENAETMGPLAACAAPPIDRHNEFQVGAEEDGGLASTAAVLRTPASTAPEAPVGIAPPTSPVAAAVEQATPPKTEAPKEMVDLIDLQADIPKAEASSKVAEADPLFGLAGLTIGEKDPYADFL